MIGMEEILGIAPGGTYDQGEEMDSRVLRLKAIRSAGLHYLLLVQQDGRCGCAKCEAELALRQETRREDEP